jgi:hypothetical protein
VKSIPSIVNSLDIEGLRARLDSDDRPEVINAAMDALCSHVTGLSRTERYPGRINTLLNMLLERGADVSIVRDGMTPLGVFARAGSLVSVKRLLKAGAIVDPPTTTNTINKTPSRHTPLMLAAAHDFCSVMQCLLEHKADVEVKDEDGETAVFWAARYGSLRALRWLEENGACLDRVDNAGDSALHACASSLGDGHDQHLVDTCKWLVDRGLSPYDQGYSVSAIEIIEDELPDLAGAMQSIFQSKQLSRATTSVVHRNSRLRL